MRQFALCLAVYLCLLSCTPLADITDASTTSRLLSHTADEEEEEEEEKEVVDDSLLSLDLNPNERNAWRTLRR